MEKFTIDKLRNAVDEAKGAIKARIGSETEKKMEDALSNKNWGASSTLLNELAQLTYEYEEYNVIMRKIWEALDSQARQWRAVFKGLTLLDHLVKNGTERVVENARDHMFKIRTLTDFRYHDGTADKGAGVREKSKQILDLLNDSDKIRDERDKAKRLRDKYIGIGSNKGSMGGSYSGGSHSSYSGENYSSSGIASSYSNGGASSGYGNSSRVGGGMGYDDYNDRRSDSRDNSFNKKETADGNGENSMSTGAAKKQSSRNKVPTEDDSDDTTVTNTTNKFENRAPSKSPSLLDEDLFSPSIPQPTKNATVMSFDPFGVSAPPPAPAPVPVTNNVHMNNFANFNGGSSINNNDMTNFNAPNMAQTMQVNSNQFGTNNTNLEFATFSSVMPSASIPVNQFQGGNSFNQQQQQQKQQQPSGFNSGMGQSNISNTNNAAPTKTDAWGAGSNLFDLNNLGSNYNSKNNVTVNNNIFNNNAIKNNNQYPVSNSFSGLDTLAGLPLKQPMNLVNNNNNNNAMMGLQQNTIKNTVGMPMQINGNNNNGMGLNGSNMLSSGNITTSIAPNGMGIRQNPMMGTTNMNNLNMNMNNMTNMSMTNMTNAMNNNTNMNIMNNMNMNHMMGGMNQMNGNSNQFSNQTNLNNNNNNNNNLKQFANFNNNINTINPLQNNMNNNFF